MKVKILWNTILVLMAVFQVLNILLTETFNVGVIVMGVLGVLFVSSMFI